MGTSKLRAKRVQCHKKLVPRVVGWGLGWASIYLSTAVATGETLALEGLLGREVKYHLITREAKAQDLWGSLACTHGEERCLF